LGGIRIFYFLTIDRTNCRLAKAALSLCSRVLAHPKPNSSADDEMKSASTDTEEKKTTSAARYILFHTGGYLPSPRALAALQSTLRKDVHAEVVLLLVKKIGSDMARLCDPLKVEVCLPVAKEGAPDDYDWKSVTFSGQGDDPPAVIFGNFEPVPSGFKANPGALRALQLLQQAGGTSSFSAILCKCSPMKRTPADASTGRSRRPIFARCTSADAASCSLRTEKTS